MNTEPSPKLDHAVDFIVGSRTFQTYYKVLGNLQAGKCPIVMLHGGPGCWIGYRDFPDSPAEFWSMDLFKDELDNLLHHLGVLASDYAATRMHSGLRILILANTFCSSKLYREGVAYWIDQLPDGLSEIIKKHKANGTTDAEEYKNAMQFYNNLHICTLDPWPQHLITSLEFAKENHLINALHRITCPTLLVSSPADEMWEPCIRPIFDKIPTYSSHLPMYETPERYVDC
ncbi:Alpha/Beta hydrolase protein [Lentinula aciculospora]|uniref:Alpha/Beta hydrolase protein n=1 Tax=Lentinula aciculospora TaxID=153920 RepID=A0A9W8ZVZ1_9AGAR|nr:Alpha/Beta hydrolase protein [Lentinula aciculospora]